jgi:hypothetical protein
VKWALPLVFLLAVSTKADTATVYVNGSYAFANNGYGIGPYGGTLTENGVTKSASFFCVDFSHNIFGNTSWNANITGLTNPSGYANTLLKSQTTYLEMAWLITQMINPASLATQTKQSTQLVQAELQWTIWALSGLNGTPNPYTSWTNQFSTLAANNYTNVSGWQILTPLIGTSPQHPRSYYGQEFMVVGTPTPEPSSVLLLVAGLSVLLAFVLKSRF